MFSGNYFRFDGTLSKQYDLRIVNIDTKTTGLLLDQERKYINTNLQSGTTFHTLGRKITDPFSFDIEIYTQNGLSMLQQRQIEKWLFDRMQYKKLEIINKDYADIYYNCRLIKPELNNYFGMMGYKCTVVGDSPWAWENEKTVSYSIVTVPSVLSFTNISDDEYVMIPKLVITCGTTGGTISLTNITDSNNLIQFTGLSENEIITIDKYGQMSSSTGNSRYDNWNGHRLNLVSGVNQLSVNGNISKVDIIYQNVRRVGY